MKKPITTTFISENHTVRSIFLTYGIQKGFTLVETLVAIAIIMTAITGPYAAAVQTINASRIAREHTVATFLAQEGVEAARAERDKVYLHDCFTSTGCSGSTAWWNNDFVKAITACTSSNPCILDTSKSSRYPTYLPWSFFEGMFSKPASLSALYRKLPNISAQFLYDGKPSLGATLTPFTRTIYASIVSKTEMEVTSKVTWKDNNKTLSIIATDHLTPWLNQ